jgi:hypothetical protein
LGMLASSPFKGRTSMDLRFYVHGLIASSRMRGTPASSMNSSLNQPWLRMRALRKDIIPSTFLRALSFHTLFHRGHFSKISFTLSGIIPALFYNSRAGKHHN